MRYVPDTTGRFQRRPHFTQEELDGECELLICDFIKRVRGGLVEFPVTTEELWRFIEERTDDVDSYADLAGYGAEVEGVTEFEPSKRPRVKIAKTLSGNHRRENRLRTTIAHEFGHVHFHACLFALEADTLTLFPKDKETQVFRGMICKRDTILRAPTYDWIEWQAGYACGAILMPVSRVKGLVQEFARTRGASSTATLSPEVLVAAVARSFQVSEQAAEVRLARLRLLPDSGLVPGRFTLSR
ncbi:MAG: ImmA/IrrE family metallo-endopeptidase [Thermoleophilia bacterium]